MQKAAAHRLLLLLSDGRPSDLDEYEGPLRGGGYAPGCQRGAPAGHLTIDQQAANYLPRVFGAHHYALLSKPERLPAVLLDWMKRLITQ